MYWLGNVPELFGDNEGNRKEKSRSHRHPNRQFFVISWLLQGSSVSQHICGSLSLPDFRKWNYCLLSTSFPQVKANSKEDYTSRSCLLSPSVPSCSSLKVLVTNRQSSNFALKTDSVKMLRKLPGTSVWKGTCCRSLAPAFSSFYSQIQLQWFQMHKSTVNHRPININWWI